MDGFLIPKKVRDALSKAKPGQAVVIYKAEPDNFYTISVTDLTGTLKLREGALTGANNIKPDVLLFIPLEVH